MNREPRAPVQKAALMDKLEGADAAELTKRVERLKIAAAPAANGDSVPPAMRELTARLEALINANHVVSRPGLIRRPSSIA